MRSVAVEDGLLDEEALALAFSPGERLDRGIFFTPAALVQEVLGRVQAYLPPHRPLAIIDPACGAGAFLAGARERFPQASLWGLELSAASAAIARERTGATILEADALRGGAQALPSHPFEVWVGNPPYNGTSPLLADPEEVERIRTLLPGVELPRGTSLRDDYALFLLTAAARLRTREGVLAFITPSSLLDSFVYAPLRQALLSALRLREVLSLGSGLFRGTRVQTCITLWTAPGPTPGTVRFQSRREAGPFTATQLGPAVEFRPEGPDWTLRPEDPEARALDEAWSRAGEPLDVAVPLSRCGVKTRFDELLVDKDPQRLWERVCSFLSTPEEALETFAAEWELAPRLLPKLRALRASLPAGVRPDRGAVRRFFQYAGARHQDGIPEADRAFCYLDRRLIPRGDHRLRGDFDPHLCPQKLIFNLRESPLSATVIDSPGCVHMYRHARFAPLWVDGQPNLSPRALRLAQRLGSPWAVFQSIARFIHSAPVQEVWAPAYATRRVLPVPLDQLTG